jgi:hypothetical protein
VVAEREGSLLVDLDLRQAAREHDEHLLHEVLDISLTDPQPPRRAVNRIQVRGDQQLEPALLVALHASRRAPERQGPAKWETERNERHASSRSDERRYQPHVTLAEIPFARKIETLRRGPSWARQSCRISGIYTQLGRSVFFCVWQGRGRRRGPR